MLTRAQCSSLQAPALAGLLPKLHMNQHKPHAVLFPGPRYGGLSLPEMYIDQGFGRLTLAVGHLKLDDENRSLQKSFITHLQLHIGSATPVFQSKYSLYEKWFEQPYWIVSLYEFLAGAKTYLDIENQWVPSISQIHDHMIMGLAIQYNFTAPELCQINTCRICLQVLTISDITMANGSLNLPTILQGHQDEQRLSTLNWPKSVRPHNWTAWTRLLQHFCTGSRLSQPLGGWIDHSYQTWLWFAVCTRREKQSFHNLTPCQVP
jgi:hypothetical protein